MSRYKLNLSDETEWLKSALRSSIENLGHPVGMGVAPSDEMMTKAAEYLAARYFGMIEALEEEIERLKRSAGEDQA